MICFLFSFLRNDTHGQNGDYDNKDYAAEIQNIFKVAYGGIDVLQQRAYSGEHQEKRAEYIGGKGLKS